VVEARVDLAAELSVLVARSPSGALTVYPPAKNHHDDRVLTWSVLPGPLEPALTREAEALGRAVAEGLQVEGLLALELFLTRTGALLVNELAPRPHNTFHTTEVACLTSQFEQCVRAVCDLPLGSAEVVRPAAIYNLFGDLWLRAEPPAFDRALALPGVRVHLYGKRQPRPGRKMGHLSAVGPTPEAALERVCHARAALGV
jgi:5-(carboxyamino)imidazole ribonucleotide synthase